MPMWVLRLCSLLLKSLNIKRITIYLLDYSDNAFIACFTTDTHCVSRTNVPLPTFFHQTLRKSKREITLQKISDQTTVTKWICVYSYGNMQAHKVLRNSPFKMYEQELRFQTFSWNILNEKGQQLLQKWANQLS